MIDVVKVVVTGAFNVGKSSFIQTISEIGLVSTELQPPENTFTIALDFGRVFADPNSVLYLFGTPGARRFEAKLFEPMLFQGERCGIVMLIDVAKEMTWREAAAVLDEVRSSDHHYVIGINRWDAPDAPPMNTLGEIFNWRDGEFVLPCNAVNRDEVAHTLITLLSQLSADSARDKLMEKLAHPSP